MGLEQGIPDLSGKIGKADIDKKGNAEFFNWSGTLQRLRSEDPGWMPEAQENGANGSWLFPSPKGCSVRVRFVHIDGERKTPWVMQALMDYRNNDIPFSEAGDVAMNKAVMRGCCKAAAVHFGLAYELWAKEPIEDVYDPTATSRAAKAAPAAAPPVLEVVPPTQTQGAPTKASVGAALKDHPAKADICKAFMTHFYPSVEGSMKASHITNDDHLVFLHDLLQGGLELAVHAVPLEAAF